MLANIRLTMLVVFSALVSVAFQQGVLASTRVDNSCTCYLMGFDCEDSSIDCSNVDDPFCTDACQGMASTCGQNWTRGWAAACTQNVSFSCACAPPGL